MAGSGDDLRVGGEYPGECFGLELDIGADGDAEYEGKADAVFQGGEGPLGFSGTYVLSGHGGDC